MPAQFHTHGDRPMDFVWLLVVVGTAIVAIVAFIKWDNRRMTRQAEHKARTVRPFPDLEEHKRVGNSA